MFHQTLPSSTKTTTKTTKTKTTSTTTITRERKELIPFISIQLFQINFERALMEMARYLLVWKKYHLLWRPEKAASLERWLARKPTVVAYDDKLVYYSKTIDEVSRTHARVHPSSYTTPPHTHTHTHASTNLHKHRKAVVVSCLPLVDQ